MDADQLCRQYLKAIEAGDFTAVLGFFSVQARVVSPLYGTQPADLYFAKLFSDSQRSTCRIIRVLTSPAPDTAIALQFFYCWTLQSGAVLEFEVVNILEMNADGNVSKLTVLYDTAPLRALHEPAARRHEPDT
ncbi:nuclear transport factor 2 family protein [Acuticoccus sp. MNP-M23]|uniref:nuclear transport factor 2 family protein n=1 Tax=Acuticoccus sp. MNP-M23 TaxID=3072793 RepID=UPI0028155003|nr:nuclear transport factor 2 family protein [Acuticoccus sp. MNP-M23]WMS42898.1 nuclear transport factor 2 family protein [Acuticoccus sp. MNP-M23]